MRDSITRFRKTRYSLENQKRHLLSPLNPGPTTDDAPLPLLFALLQVIIFLLYSFWVPQIVVNAVKGTRQPLNRTYVVGMSATRLIIPLYVYGCPQNFVHLLFSDYKPDYRVSPQTSETWATCRVGVRHVRPRRSTAVRG